MYLRFTDPDDRFNFKGLWLVPGKTRRLDYTIGFSTPAQIQIGCQGDQVFARPDKGQTFVNREPLTRERVLSEGYLIRLDGKHDHIQFVMQRDLVAARQARLATAPDHEKTLAPPDFSGKQRYKTWIRKRFSATADGVKVKRHKIPWDELHEVAFAASEGAGVGGSVAAELATAVVETVGQAKGESTFDELFSGSSMYSVYVRSMGKNKGMIVNTQARSCVLVAQAVDYYAPIDVVKLGI